jgi:hypothetical protein
LIFFRGFVGENAHYGFGVHQTDGSAYCSQEKENTGDEKFFEIFWEPENMQFTAATDDETRAKVKYGCPKGLSGSLVWNTRYLETTSTGAKWTPNHAVVTGLLRRWDKDTKTLLVWRVEHLLAWLWTSSSQTRRKFSSLHGAQPGRHCLTADSHSIGLFYLCS